MAINDLFCSITANLDIQLHCLGIFLDLSKAFDTLTYCINSIFTVLGALQTG